MGTAGVRDTVATDQINVGSINNILKAIRAQPDPDAAHLEAIGSTAMTGSRLPPIHEGRVGDPIAPAVGGHCAVSRIEAERLVMESGLAHWASLRRTSICVPRLLNLLHPILFHRPVNTVFEFVTARDSDRLLATRAKRGSATTSGGMCTTSGAERIAVWVFRVPCSGRCTGLLIPEGRVRAACAELPGFGAC